MRAGPGETGRRGRRPLRGGLPREGQFLENGLTRGSGPTGWSIDRKAVPEKADTYPLPPDERQRKEELVHSSRDKPPLNLIARGKSFRLRRSFSRAPVASPVTSFSLLDRARPVFSFSSGRKRENGGCKGPAIFMAEIPPPARASITPPPAGENASKPPLRRALAPPPPGPPPPPPGWP